MAKKPVAKKTKPAGALRDVKPTKADSMLRIDTSDDVAADAEVVETPETKVAKKPAAKKAVRKPAAAKEVADPRIVVMHGDTRLTHTDELGRLALEAMTTLIDEVHALGRVRITGASHGTGMTTLHTVLPGHPTPYEDNPGIILSVDGLDGLVSFDHVVIGIASAALVDDAAFTLLTAVKGDAENPANGIGRRADWYEVATVAADEVGMRFVRA